MQNGSRSSALFVFPHGYMIPKSYKLLFPCKNNIAEYEDLKNGQYSVRSGYKSMQHTYSHKPYQKALSFCWNNLVLLKARCLLGLL